MADSKPDTRSASQIEADIDAKRKHLAGTVDELAVKAHPKNIARRAMNAARASFDEAVYTSDGTLRTDRVSAALGCAGALLIGMGLARRRRG